MTALLWFIPGIPLAVCAALAAAGGRARRAAGPAAAAAAALSLVAALPLAGKGAASSAEWLSVGRLTATVGLRADGVGWTFAVLVATVSAVVNVYSVGYMRGKEGGVRFFAWMVFFEGSMLALVLADSLLLLFAAWEAVGLASFVLIAHHHEDPQARRAGAQAFLVTRAGDFAMLAALVLALLATGTTDLEALLGAGADPLDRDVVLALALLFLLAAVAKSAQLPLTAWLPDAMIGPTPVSALLHSATMVAAGTFLVIRLWPLFAAAPDVLAVLRVVGGATALAAALAATAGDDLKRVLAWSTVDHLGITMLALGLAGPVAAAFHLVAHASMKAGLFLAAGAVEEEAGTRSLSRLGGLGRAMPWTAGAFAVCALALAGVLPLAGFYSEEQILSRAIHHGWLWGALVVVLIFLAGVYAARAGAAAFLRWPGAPVPAAVDPGRAMRGATAAFAAGSVAIGIALDGRIADALELPRPDDAIGAGWRAAAIAASIAGIALGIRRVRSRGPVAALGTWVEGAPAAVAALVDAPARLSLALARASGILEAAVDRGARATARAAETIVGVAAGAERVLDGAARAAARGGIGAADRVERFETAGLSRAVDGAAAAIGRGGDRVRRTETGQLWVYTGAVAFFVLVVAAIVALVALAGARAGG